MTIGANPAHAFMPYPPVSLSSAEMGPLSGLTFAVKDLFDVAGYPTSGGNPHMLALSGIKRKTAPVVQSLLDAGAQFLGKTYTDELAYSMSGINAHFGAPRNGAAPDRITGGSSSGSAAAVSNNLVDFALGTDTGGSVRCPSSHCGLIGLRPTHGLINLEGCLPLAPSLDTCGWLARDISVFARVGAVLLDDDAAPLPEKIRLLTPVDGWGLLEKDVVSTLSAARKRVKDLFGPARPITMAPGGFDRSLQAARFIQGREAWLSDGEIIEKFGLVLGPGVRERFLWSKGVIDQQLDQSWVIRREIRDYIGALLGQDGVLMLPTMPDIAPLLTATDAEVEEYRLKSSQILCLAGLTGFPQISLPLAIRNDCPLGLSLLGPAGSDQSLIRLAAKIMA